MAFTLGNNIILPQNKFFMSENIFPNSYKQLQHEW